MEVAVAPTIVCGASTECAASEACTAFDFVPVATGSDVLSPANRTSPAVTDAQGHFGWDVTAGYYKVQAEKVNVRFSGNGDFSVAAKAPEVDTARARH